MKKLKQSYKEKTGLTIGVPRLHPAFSTQASSVVPSFRVQSCLTSSSISFNLVLALEKYHVAFVLPTKTYLGETNQKIKSSASASVPT